MDSLGLLPEGSHAAGAGCPMQADFMLCPELPMEHRWGTRIAVHIPVRVTAAYSSVVRLGRITNLSLSGAFIFGFGLRLHSRIQVSVEYSTLLQRPVEKLAALVARVCDEGAGIVWCEFAPRPVLELLRTAISVVPEFASTAHKSIRS